MLVSPYLSPVLPHRLTYIRRRRYTREDLGPDPEHQRQGRVVRQQARRPFPPQAQEDQGQHINTASVVALVGSATPQLAYTASKGAVLAMTRELAIVHAREGFRFNALCPAPLNTPLLQDWLGDDQPKRHRREVHFPSGRFGEAIEQAQAVLFLASDEASFVNGSDFVVDGGMTKAYVTPEGPATAAPTNLAR
jgi:NAD(P)-dependent dehydrogenase (short-subunit alcohol dehydrogenase family)